MFLTKPCKTLPLSKRQNQPKSSKSPTSRIFNTVNISGWLQNYFNAIQTPNTFENRIVVGNNRRILTRIFSVDKKPRPRPHVSGYFWIRNFFFPDKGFRPHAFGEFCSIFATCGWGVSAQVVRNGQRTQPLNMRTWVKQGCLLPPPLLLVGLDWVTRTAFDRKRSIQWTFTTYLTLRPWLCRWSGPTVTQDTGYDG